VDRLWGFQVVKIHIFANSSQMKVLSLSALCTGRPYPQRNITVTHFLWRLNRLQGHSAAGRIMSMKNSSDTIGNQTGEIPACSTVPQPTAPPAACLHCMKSTTHNHSFSENYFNLMFRTIFTYFLHSSKKCVAVTKLNPVTLCSNVGVLISSDK
jgi:hypothetical protein